jgi:membrane protein implicated in regulation of membrane protease activity
MLLELVVPGFVLCFFGMAAATVGAIRLGLGEAFSPTWQLAVFSISSVLYIVLLRRWLKSVFVGDKVDRDASISGECVGRPGRVTAAIAPGVPGRVMIGDAEWNAEAAVPIVAGTAVRVVAQNNLTLTVAAV